MNDVRSRKWVRRLPGIMHALNTTVTRLTGEAAIKAHSKHLVETKPVKYDRDVGFKEKRLGIHSLVRYLLRPGEEERGEVRRATGPVWYWEMYYIDRYVVNKDQPVLYYLLNGPKRGFVREELQIVPDDTETPPDFVLKH